MKPSPRYYQDGLDGQWPPMTRRAANVLSGGGISSMRELDAKTDAELRAMPNCGPRTFVELRAMTRGGSGWKVCVRCGTGHLCAKDKNREQGNV